MLVLTFHLHTHTRGHAACAPPTRITPTNTSSAALEPRPTPTPVIGQPCSSWYTHAHALARSHARSKRRPPSHRHRSFMAGSGGDGWEVSSAGNHREGRGVAWVWWRAWWVAARTHIIHQLLSGSVRLCLAGVAAAGGHEGRRYFIGYLRRQIDTSINRGDSSSLVSPNKTVERHQYLS